MLGLLLVFLFELTRLVQPRQESQDTQGRGMHGSNMVAVAKKVKTNFFSSQQRVFLMYNDTQNPEKFVPLLYDAYFLRN